MTANAITGTNPDASQQKETTFAVQDDDARRHCCRRIEPAGRTRTAVLTASNTLAECRGEGEQEKGPNQMLDDFTRIGANRKGGEARAEAALFRQARHALGMTQSDITRALLVGNWRTIALWEAGDSQPPSPIWLAAIHLLEEIATPERQSAKAAIDREVLTS